MDANQLLASQNVFIKGVNELKSHQFKDNVPTIQVTPLSLEVEATPLQNPLSY